VADLEAANEALQARIADLEDRNANLEALLASK
jgi:cell division protein FtsB